jgi:hypothetical protein
MTHENCGHDAPEEDKLAVEAMPEAYGSEEYAAEIAAEAAAREGKP